MSKPKRQPIVVYLDSQDFSRFSPSSAEYEKYLPIRKELLALKRAKKVKFVFSDVHVRENFPQDAQSISFGLERIEVISEFCGKNNLPCSVSVIKSEIRELQSNDKSIGSKRPWKEWFPEVDFSSMLLPAQETNHIKNRKTRREAEKHGKQRAKIAKAQALEEIRKILPINSIGQQKLIAYIFGNADRAVVEEAIVDSLRDIRTFSKWAINNKLGNTYFVDTLRRPAEEILEQLIDFQAELAWVGEKLYGEGQEHQTENLILKTRQDFKRSIELTATSIMSRSRLKKSDIPSEAVISKVLTPGAILFWNYLEEIMWQSIGLKHSRRPVRSDLADSMHILFLPCVDLFRCDAFARSALLKVAPQYAGRLVRQLSELPELIRQRAMV